MPIILVLNYLQGFYHCSAEIAIERNKLDVLGYRLEIVGP